jgi:hypothetical protein
LGFFLVAVRLLIVYAVNCASFQKVEEGEIVNAVCEFGFIFGAATFSFGEGKDKVIIFRKAWLGVVLFVDFFHRSSYRFSW